MGRVGEMLGPVWSMWFKWFLTIERLKFNSFAPFTEIYFESKNVALCRRQIQINTLSINFKVISIYIKIRYIDLCLLEYL